MPVKGDFVVVFECLDEVERMIFSCVFDSEVVYDEGEYDRDPSVFP